MTVNILKIDEMNTTGKIHIVFNYKDLGMGEKKN